jgi:hypothetical protein
MHGLNVEIDKIDPLWSAWFSGLVDGEGYFNFSSTSNSPRFEIAMKEDELDLLKEIQQKLGCGSITRMSKSYMRQRGSKAKDAFRFGVFNLRDNLKIIIPVLDRYQLHSTKRYEYLEWRKIVHSSSQRDGKLSARMIAEVIDDFKRKKKDRSTFLKSEILLPDDL